MTCLADIVYFSVARSVNIASILLPYGPVGGFYFSADRPESACHTFFRLFVLRLLLQ